MAKQGESKVIPRLRFPEFRKAAEWEKKPLSELLDYERPEKYIVADAVYQDNGTPVLTANKSFILGYTNESEGIYSATPVVIFDDFTTDKKYVDFPFKVKSSAIKILKARGGDSLRLIFELMGGIKFKPKEHKRYYISEYQNLEIAIPKQPEQQKITDCLTLLDEVIAAQGQKVEALKAHKRGLMQQLFPREGETRPRLRFPEFRNAPEWEEATIGSRSKSFSGGTPETTDRSYYGGTIPFIRSAEIGSKTTELFLTERGLQNSAAKLVEEGDVLVALYGANSGDVALAKTSGAINQAILCVRPIGSKPFLCHFLSHKKGWIVATFIQGGQGNLSGEIVKSITLRFPSVEEQQRIADCLSSVDTHIAAESDQLAVLKTHKQGLMQQLFPAPEGD